MSRAVIIGVIVVVLLIGTGTTVVMLASKSKITPGMVGIARREAAKNGIPYQWVLQTIHIESRGNPNAVGDNGKSIGLMQINTAAHPELATAGITVERLKDPATNIMYGTKYLAAAYRAAQKDIATYKLNIPVDLLTRIIYNAGHGTVLERLKTNRDPRGINPKGVIAWGESAAATQGLA